MNKMKGKGILKRIALCSVALTMLASATACGKPENVGGKIAVIAKNEKVSFWNEVKKGAEDSCEELGYELLYYTATNDNDYASQIEAVNKALDAGAKAIVIAPNDPNELNSVFDKATKRGVKILNINSRSNYDGIVSYVGSSDFDGGAVAARNAANIYFSSISEDEENIGKIAMIGHTAATADLRLTGFRATISPTLGKFIGERQAAKAKEEAEEAQSGSKGGTSSGGGSPVEIAANAAATQAAQGGAPEQAILNAALGAARSAAAGTGASEADIQAAAQAAVAAVTGGAPADTEAPEDTTETEADDEQTQDGPPAGGADMIADFFIEGERCGTQEAAYEEAKKLIEANPDIRVMYTTNTNTTLGACKAVEELELADQITLVGFNSDEEELKYIKSGILDGTIIQNPYTIGYIGTRYAIQAAQGQGVTGSLDTGVTWISAKNINDDDIQLLLYPEKA